MVSLEKLIPQAHNIEIRSRYIPGHLNVLADQLSRKNQVLPSEWSLHPDICKQIWKTWEWPQIDLFATSQNHKLPVYMSPLPDPASWDTDALVQPWDQMIAYAYPQVSLIRAVLNKVLNSQNLTLLLVAPMWPQQEWCPDLLHLLVDEPRELPKWRKLLKQSHLNRFHLNPDMLELHV